MPDLDLCAQVLCTHQQWQTMSALVPVLASAAKAQAVADKNCRDCVCSAAKCSAVSGRQKLLSSCLQVQQWQKEAAVMVYASAVNAWRWQVMFAGLVVCATAECVQAPVF